MSKSQPSLARIKFFEKQVHDPRWKDSMSGKNEESVIKILDACNFTLGTDYVRQHPIGERFVIDFAFINEQIALEVDGDNHNTTKQKKLDKMRDRYLRDNNWIPIRVRDKELFGTKLSFYKSLFNEIVKERRKQYQIGELLDIDIPYFNQDDYE